MIASVNHSHNSHSSRNICCRFTSTFKPRSSTTATIYTTSRTTTDTPTPCHVGHHDEKWDDDRLLRGRCREHARVSWVMGEAVISCCGRHHGGQISHCITNRPSTESPLLHLYMDHCHKILFKYILCICDNVPSKQQFHC